MSAQPNAVRDHADSDQLVVVHVRCPKCSTDIEVPRSPDREAPTPPADLIEMMYHPGRRWRGWLSAAQLVAGVMLAVTAVVVTLYLLRSAKLPIVGANWTIEPDLELLYWLIGCWAFWVVAPPAWFGFEYFYLYNRTASAERFSDFKYGQEITTKAWYTLVILLSAILYKSFK